MSNKSGYQFPQPYASLVGFALPQLQLAVPSTAIHSHQNMRDARESSHTIIHLSRREASRQDALGTSTTRSAEDCAMANPRFLLLLLVACTLPHPCHGDEEVECDQAAVDASTWLWWSFRLGSCTSLKLNNSTLGPRGAIALARALRGNTELRELKLERCGLGAQGAAALASVLASTKIEKLDLEANAIGLEGAVAIAQALPAAQVSEIDLEDNAILDGGAIALAEALAESRSMPLVSLDIENNAIGDAGIAALAGALRKNAGLEELDLHGNQVGPKALRALASALVANRKLTRLSLPDPSPLASVRSRRFQGSMLKLLDELVSANEEGATRAKKQALSRRVWHRQRASKRQQRISLQRGRGGRGSQRQRKGGRQAGKTKSSIKKRRARRRKGPGRGYMR